MDVLQAWVIVGVPVLAVVLGLFTGQSQQRAWAGHALLVGLVVFFVTVPGDVLSASALGILVVAFVATGRGSHRDEGLAEHHQNRKRLTTAREGGSDAP
ncbi:hypothetical protein [Egicoccus halophilus]|uniref:Uncharacterized protein n=1 Tax=Egicoccus halophilus TaxID=1670830 RepID=A0A8J3AFC3_9ACTN|nr:hypothetical protein [Egicoccus halophilus]GGI06608.1 hypothetical protein GCM10011354_19940 [Egicoccus halophilus]